MQNDDDESQNEEEYSVDEHDNYHFLAGRNQHVQRPQLWLLVIICQHKENWFWNYWSPLSDASSSINI